MTNTGGPFGPIHPDTVNGECYGFAYVGQSYKTCNTCGEPFWEHQFEAAFDRDKGFWRRVIPAKEAELVRANWEHR